MGTEQEKGRGMIPAPFLSRGVLLAQQSEPILNVTVEVQFSDEV